MRKYLALEEVAKIYPIEVRKLRRMCRLNEVRASKVGRCWFIAPDDMERVFRKGVNIE